MITRTVDTRTLWAILAMEGALALPLISLPTQGDRITGLAGPVLLLLLLPAGYIAIYELRALRDPSWRLLAGIGLALFTRLIVATIPGADVSGLFGWLARSIVPAVIGVALWWRGGALAAAEVTPAEVRAEFSLVAVCLVAVLSLIRPFLLPDPLLLGGSVGLFAIAGLIGTALSRQVAGSVGPPRSSVTLAVVSSLLIPGAAVLLVGVLRPELLGSMWSLLARLIELALTPIGMLIAWLASLFPRISMGAPPPPPARPVLPTVDPSLLADSQERMQWLATLIILLLLAMAAAGLIVAAKMLLENWARDPKERSVAPVSTEVVAERSGKPGNEAADLFGWLLRWFRSRFSRPRRAADGSRTDVASPVDAWAAYRQLLTWAEAQGLGRRPAETTGQLSRRLRQHTPTAADSVDLVTRTYEYDRYGALHPTRDALRRLRDALHNLS